MPLSPKSRRRPCSSAATSLSAMGATVALDRFTVSLAGRPHRRAARPNGSGKTTLLKMIAGVAHPTAGDIRVAGYEVGPESKALVSYLPERPYFSRSMRVRGDDRLLRRLLRGLRRRLGPGHARSARRSRGRPVRGAFQGHR